MNCIPIAIIKRKKPAANCNRLSGVLFRSISKEQARNFLGMGCHTDTSGLESFDLVGG
jgi:hypothetical protein